MEAIVMPVYGAELDFVSKGSFGMSVCDCINCCAGEGVDNPSPTKTATKTTMLVYVFMGASPCRSPVYVNESLRLICPMILLLPHLSMTYVKNMTISKSIGEDDMIFG
jgi:hypothetical protein